MDKSDLMRELSAHRAEEKLKRDKTIQAMVMTLTIVGANVVIPEEGAQQIAPQPEVKQWENFLIDAHTTDPKKLAEVLVALAVRIMPAGDLIKFSDNVQFAVSQVLQYIMGHEEIHDNRNLMERISGFFGLDE